MAQLNEQRFLILAGLAGGPRHGYGLVEEIAELTDGRVRPRAGALYHALDRLGAAGLVVVDREEAVDGRLRRYHRLTDDGRRVLAEEAERRAVSARRALERLGLAT
ncbi:MAG: PadR family transcriptional regulator [Actinomycetota bacterium]|nr:PadR family transcriptional regulator [Actinomycetota bacterium]